MASQKIRILLLGEIRATHESWTHLNKIADIVKPNVANREEFIRECRNGRYDGSLVAYRTMLSPSIAGVVDEEIVSVLPKSLKYICHCGSGYDQVSIPACTSRRILVSNTPDVVNEATADATIFLMLGALRNFNPGIATLRDRRWRGQPPIGIGHDPQGKTLGILGMGGIGRNVMAKAEAFGMKVQYSNRNKLPDGLSGGAKFVSFEELLATSDVISTNLPMNPQTRHILNKAAFQQMKDGVVIVNTARGGVIDEAELVNALDSGKVRSCGLDVFEDEPTIHEGLLRNPNVFLTPHMAAWTHETLFKMEALAIENVRAAVETGRLKTVVKEQRDLHL